MSTRMNPRAMQPTMGMTQQMPGMGNMGGMPVPFGKPGGGGFGNMMGNMNLGGLLGNIFGGRRDSPMQPTAGNPLETGQRMPELPGNSGGPSYDDMVRSGRGGINPGGMYSGGGQPEMAQNIGLATSNPAEMIRRINDPTNAHTMGMGRQPRAMQASVRPF